MIAPQVLAPHIAHLVAASPLQAGPLSTALCDLSLAVQWCELRPLQLPGTQWVAVVGRKKTDVSEPESDLGSRPNPYLLPSLPPSLFCLGFGFLKTD